MTITIGAQMGISVSNGIVIGPSVGVQLSGRAGDGPLPEILLRDDFLTNEAAPLASPRTCEPGPGTIDISDPSNLMSISGGRLIIAAGSGSTDIDGPAMDMVAGRAVVGVLRATVSNGPLEIGWDAGATGSVNDGIRVVDNAATIRDSLSAVSADTLERDVDYRVAVVRSSTGFWSLIRGGAFTNWTLMWVSVTSAVTRYPHLAVGTSAAAGTAGTFRVWDLPAPFADDYGLATDRKAGSVSAGTTFSHRADCHIGYVQTTLPSADYTDLYVRRIDDDNTLVLSTDNTGLMELFAVSGGNWSSLGASSAGAVANGNRCVVICDGPTIRVYSSNTLRITGTSSVGQSATNGRLAALGTSGAVSDLVSWPRTLSGQAASILNFAVA